MGLLACVASSLLASISLRGSAWHAYPAGQSTHFAIAFLIILYPCVPFDCRAGLGAKDHVLILSASRVLAAKSWI